MAARTERVRTRKEGARATATKPPPASKTAPRAAAVRTTATKVTESSTRWRLKETRTVADTVPTIGKKVASTRMVPGSMAAE